MDMDTYSNIHRGNTYIDLGIEMDMDTYTNIYTDIYRDRDSDSDRDIAAVFVYQLFTP